MKRGRLNKEDKELILKRDEYKCRKCSSTDRLQIHHMNLCNWYDEDQLSENLITLCVYCHHGLHSKKWKLEDIGLTTPNIKYNPMQSEYYNITDEQMQEAVEKKALI